MGREEPHAVGIHGGFPQLIDELVIDHDAYHGTDARYQLCHFCQVNIVAVFLLKGAPVELVDVIGQLVLLYLPVVHLQVHVPPVLLAAESQLKNVQNVNPLFIILYIKAIQGGNIKQHF